MKRFFDKIEIIPFHSCWERSAGISKHGYGKFKFNKKTVYAHRFSYEFHFGQIPICLFVCHKCDNPSCVRPEHLFLGSHAENMRDMISKGRKVTYIGSKAKIYGNTKESNPAAKLNSIKVGEIRQSYKTGNKSQASIGMEYGVSQRTISLIVRNETWN